jgi:putative membrane protein
MAENEPQQVHKTVVAEARKVSESAKHLERSAGAVVQSAIVQTDSADRRTELAANRTVLAAERTYAAWVRTGLAALASGVGARALLVPLLPLWLGKLSGSVLIVFGGFCFLAAIWREMKPGVPPPKPDTANIPSSILLLLNGALVLICLSTLVAIWISPLQ